MNLLPDPPIGSYESTALAKADFNNDGQMDICIQSVNRIFLADTFGVGIVLSNGTGSYSAFPTYSLSTDRVILATAGDFTNDGKQDIIAVCQNDSAFYLLTGNGTGGFTSKTTFTTVAVPNSIVTADFNNDGKPDIAYSCTGSPKLTIMYGSATGLLNTVNYVLGSLPTLILPADFNNDTYLDILALSGGISFFLQGAANGTFTTVNSINLNVVNVIAEDVNADNKLDLITTDIVNSTVNILTGNGNFTFATPVSYSITGVGGGLFMGPVASADFNGDGKKDLVTVGSAPLAGLICIFPGLGNGTFTTAVTYSLSFSTSFILLYNFVVTDFNNDTRPDIIALVSDDGVDPFCQVKLFENCDGAISVGIKETSNNGMNFNLYPNPASDFLQVQIEEIHGGESGTAKIYNDLGQIVMEKKLVFENEKAIIKTRDLPNGVYTLRLNGAGTISKRFVITN